MRQLLLRILDEAYERKGWHGPTLRGALRGVSDEEAAWRPGEGRHNIHELVIHAAYWKFVVRRRLAGDRRDQFPRPGRNWFPPTAPFREDVALLDEQHRFLRQTVESAKINERLIYGVAMHDVYHAGQIGLIKRLSGS
jgi:uncharacterized damage-inducible protein DinB